MILSLKKSLLVIYKILRLFVNTFTTDDKYSRLNRDNLTQLIHMKLCQKKIFFGILLVVFWKLNQISNNLKKRLPHSEYISEITDSQKRG